MKFSGGKDAMLASLQYIGMMESSLPAGWDGMMENWNIGNLTYLENYR